MYSKGSEIVGDVRNVGNASEEVRSKVWAMTSLMNMLPMKSFGQSVENQQSAIGN